MRPARECPISPAEAASVFYDGWEDSPKAQLYARLLTDDRMNVVWAALKAATKKTEASAEEWDWFYVLDNISVAYFSAENRGGWDLMTGKEREQWLADTRAAVKNLRSLIAQADGSWDGDGPNKYHPGDTPNTFTMDSVLYWFDRHLERVEPARAVRKPKDEKAPRAEFIERVTKKLHDLQLHLTDSVIADLCAVVQDDDSVTPSLVSKFRYRANPLRLVGDD